MSQSPIAVKINLFGLQIFSNFASGMNLVVEKGCAMRFAIHTTPYLIAFAIYSVFVAECRKF